jgi:hypothetical protein
MNKKTASFPESRFDADSTIKGAVTRNSPVDYAHLKNVIDILILSERTGWICLVIRFNGE